MLKSLGKKTEEAQTNRQEDSPPRKKKPQRGNNPKL